MIPRLSSFSARLRAARKELGLDQAAFGALAGVQRTAQSNYEKGDRSPDVDYLLRIGDAGIDIVQLLTGVPSEVPAFEAWEIETVARLRAITAEQRQAIDTVLKGLTGQDAPLISQRLHSGGSSFAQDGDKR